MAAEPGRLAMVSVLAWLIPGAGHLLLKRRQKGLVFLIALPLMFVVGLWLEGRLFPLRSCSSARLPIAGSGFPTSSPA